jgi:hypothetical protein
MVRGELINLERLEKFGDTYQIQKKLITCPQILRVPKLFAEPASEFLLLVDFWISSPYIGLEIKPPRQTKNRRAT